MVRQGIIGEHKEKEVRHGRKVVVAVGAAGVAVAASVWAATGGCVGVGVGIYLGVGGVVLVLSITVSATVALSLCHTCALSRHVKCRNE